MSDKTNNMLISHMDLYPKMKFHQPKFVYSYCKIQIFLIDAQMERANQIIPAVKQVGQQLNQHTSWVDNTTSTSWLTSPGNELILAPFCKNET